MERSTRVPVYGWIVAAVCAMCATLALCTYLQLPQSFTHRFVLLPAAAGLTALGAQLFRCNRARLRRYALIAGAAFGMAQVCGERLAVVGTLAQTGWDFAWLALCAVGLAPALGQGFVVFVRGLERARGNARSQGKRSSAKLFWISTAVLIACWLPYLLAFYPGLFTYDISYQYLQYTTKAFNTHHPLLHTLLVGGFCDLGRLLFGYPSKGVLLYTLFQMSVMALVMSSATALLYRRKAPAWVCVVLIALEAILPFHTLLVISTTKDTLFAGAVLYLCVLLAQAAFEPDVLRKPWWSVRFVLTEMAVGMLRNNGFICIAAVLVLGVIAICRRRKAGKRMTALALCGLVLFGAGQAGLKAAVGAQNGPMGEMFSVPVQQLSRVYVLTEDEEKAEIEKYLPNASLYARTISDPVKANFAVAPSELPDFLRLWVRVGLRHPVIYMDAWGFLTRGFYQLDEMPAGQYLETAFHEDEAAWMVPHSLWPGLRDLMAKLYSENGHLSVPLWSALLSTALWCWLLLWTLLAALYLRSGAALKAGLPLLMLFLTVLLGPCVMLRYIYPLMLAGPFVLGMLTVPPKIEE